MPNGVQLAITANQWKVKPSSYFPDLLKTNLEQLVFDDVVRFLYWLWLSDGTTDEDEDGF